MVDLHQVVQFDAATRVAEHEHLLHSDHFGLLLRPRERIDRQRARLAQCLLDEVAVLVIGHDGDPFRGKRRKSTAE